MIKRWFLITILWASTSQLGPILGHFWWIDLAVGLLCLMIVVLTALAFYEHDFIPCEDEREYL